MQRVTAYVHHRFDYLRQGLPKHWDVVSHPMLVDKTMLWDSPTLQVCWEHHDGVTDDVQEERTERLELFLQARDRRKSFVYVKPNFSVTRSQKFVQFVQSNGGQLVVPNGRWSYYPFHKYVFENRARLRAQAQRPFGPCVSYYGSRSNANYSFDRRRAIDLAEALYDDSFRAIRIDDPETLANAITNTTYVFQPHGIGIRHNVYECMALGVPCIIPEISYLTPALRHCHVIHGSLLPKWDALSDEIARDERAALCIEEFERNMTPQAIVLDVLGKL